MFRAAFRETGKAAPEPPRQATGPARVLIVDDDELFGALLTDLVQELGFEVQLAGTLADGLAQARQGDFDAVFLDLRLPDGSGLELLPHLRELPAPPEVVLLTGAGDPDGAELVLANGAWDYVERQSSIKRMVLALTRALRYRTERRSGRPRAALILEGIVGCSPAMRACYDRLAQAAACDATVLLRGEAGTGKELFAHAIHRNSARAAGPFVRVDCAALPPALAERTLFGGEPGSGPGAGRAQAGLLQQADGGTLFLKEVAELPPAMQQAFARVLKERRYRPVGAREEREDHFRLLAATSRDLEQLAAQGAFHRDLLMELRGLTLELPPLRERREDIRELALFHTARLCEAAGCGVKGLAPEFLQSLATHDWPENVRELVQLLEQALAAAGPEPTLRPRHLPAHLRPRALRTAWNRQERSDSPGAPAPAFPRLKAFREAAVIRAEREYLQDLMQLANNSIKEACKLAALSVPRLYALLKKHQIRH